MSYEWPCWNSSFYGSRDPTEKKLRGLGSWYLELRHTTLHSRNRDCALPGGRHQRRTAAEGEHLRLRVSPKPQTFDAYQRPHLKLSEGKSWPKTHSYRDFEACLVLKVHRRAVHSLYLGRAETNLASSASVCIFRRASAAAHWVRPEYLPIRQKTGRQRHRQVSYLLPFQHNSPFWRNSYCAERVHKERHV